MLSRRDVTILQFGELGIEGMVDILIVIQVSCRLAHRGLCTATSHEPIKSSKVPFCLSPNKPFQISLIGDKTQNSYGSCTWWYVCTVECQLLADCSVSWWPLLSWMRMDGTWWFIQVHAHTLFDVCALVHCAQLFSSAVCQEGKCPWSFCTLLTWQQEHAHYLHMHTYIQMRALHTNMQINFAFICSLTPFFKIYDRHFFCTPT
jgi:hypothetical protein